MRGIPVLVASAVLSVAITLLTYFYNNYGVCCDQVFVAGWPWPFYGGSGGFIGSTEDKILWTGLVLDLAFWFVISTFIVFVLGNLIKSRKKN